MYPESFEGFLTAKLSVRPTGDRSPLQSLRRTVHDQPADQRATPRRIAANIAKLPVPPTPPAMPVKVVVNPTGVGASRRPPEWVPPHRADNATDH